MQTVSRLQAGSSSSFVCRYKTTAHRHGPGVVGATGLKRAKAVTSERTRPGTASTALLLPMLQSIHYSLLFQTVLLSGDKNCTQSCPVGSLAMLVPFITILIYPIRSSNCSV